MSEPTLDETLRALCGSGAVFGALDLNRDLGLGLVLLFQSGGEDGSGKVGVY